MHKLAELYSLLEGADCAKRNRLAELIGSSFGSDAKHLCDHFLYLRYGAVGQFAAPSTYKQIVTDLADELQIDWSAIDPHADWEALQTTTIELAIGRRIYAGSYELSDPFSVSIRPVKAFVRTLLQEGIGSLPMMPHGLASQAANSLADRFSRFTANLGPSWKALLAGVMYVHLEVRDAKMEDR